MKKCAKCLQEFVDTDFYDDICFKCTYKAKAKIIMRYVCRLCGKDLPRKGLRYCSEGCRDIAKAHQLKNHWTKKILSNGQSW